MYELRNEERKGEKEEQEWEQGKKAAQGSEATVSCLN